MPQKKTDTEKWIENCEKKNWSLYKMKISRNKLLGILMMMTKNAPYEKFKLMWIMLRNVLA